VNLPFTKVEGLGNNFVLVDWRAKPLQPGLLDELSKLAPTICDAHRGVGADGILVVLGGLDAVAQMVVINHDGSRPEMCGNGLRCVAQFVAKQAPETVLIRTDAGDLTCHIIESTARGGQVRVDMGPAQSSGCHLVSSCPGYSFHTVSMGNPHAITFVADPNANLESLARLHGPRVEVDTQFPNRTNVEFARIDRRGEVTEIELWVWERGCGLTLACGTGACATAAAAVRAGLAPANRDITVNLPGGALTIRVPADPQASVQMTGPARQVFVGTYRT